MLWLEEARGEFGGYKMEVCFVNVNKDMYFVEVFDCFVFKVFYYWVCEGKCKGYEWFMCDDLVFLCVK